MAMILVICTDSELTRPGVGVADHIHGAVLKRLCGVSYENPHKHKLWRDSSPNVIDDAYNGRVAMQDVNKKLHLVCLICFYPE